MPASLLAMLFTLAVLGCKKEEEAFEILPTPPQADVLPRHWELPGFTLTERSGRAVSLADLRGKVWVADFFYTSCPGPCPMLTSRLGELHKATRGFADVAVVSISSDPDKDTPDVLQSYATKFGADGRWLFLTGGKPAIYELANKGFKLGLSEEGGTEKEPVTHSTKLVLVDKNGTVRGFYDGLGTDETPRLLRDIERLRNESR